MILTDQTAGGKPPPQTVTLERVSKFASESKPDESKSPNSGAVGGGPTDAPPTVDAAESSGSEASQLAGNAVPSLEEGTDTAPKEHGYDFSYVITEESFHDIHAWGHAATALDIPKDDAPWAVEQLRTFSYKLQNGAQGDALLSELENAAHARGWSPEQFHGALEYARQALGKRQPQSQEELTSDDRPAGPPEAIDWQHKDAIERIMREDRQRYDRDQEMQQDYRDLLEELQGADRPARQPASDTSRQAEIQKYHTMMGDRSSEYWRGPSAARHQERYRSLLRGRG